MNDKKLTHESADKDYIAYITRNKKLQAQLYWGLKALRDGEAKYNVNMGICFNLARLLDDNIAYTFVRLFSDGWLHDSGVVGYPVPEPDGHTYLWEDEQLEYRMSLINYLIQQLEAM